MRRTRQLASGPAWHQDETKATRLDIGDEIQRARALLRDGRCREALRRIGRAHVLIGVYVTHATSTKRKPYIDMGVKGKAGMERKLDRMTDEAVACLRKGD